VGLGLLAREMNVEKRLLKKVGQWTHERISQAPKMSPIPHFLREDIGRVDSTGNMQDLQVGILYPFTHCILPHFHVSNLFRGHFVRPTDTKLVVSIKR